MIAEAWDRLIYEVWFWECSIRAPYYCECYCCNTTRSGVCFGASSIAFYTTSTANQLPDATGCIEYYCHCTVSNCVCSSKVCNTTDEWRQKWVSFSIEEA